LLGLAPLGLSGWAVALPLAAVPALVLTTRAAILREEVDPQREARSIIRGGGTCVPLATLYAHRSELTFTNFVHVPVIEDREPSIAIPQLVDTFATGAATSSIRIYAVAGLDTAISKHTL
jgi:hypothetical protein